MNQIPLIQAGPVNIRGMVPQWTAQPMQPAAPHPLMARPLIVNSPQNSEVRGPAPRFQAPLIAQAGSPAQVGTNSCYGLSLKQGFPGVREKSGIFRIIVILT